MNISWCEKGWEVQHAVRPIVISIGSQILRHSLRTVLLSHPSNTEDSGVLTWQLEASEFHNYYD